ncbi:calcium/sodium antiporter [Legionella hackeliae]|uniref:Ca2 /Na antiporter n=1 Tax=Legionella hackeliae TaxID=449 RepID=A0A0A8UWF8_LEGHA|nr:calcium/sodium antiporter [Legionella hackeliae]KTD09604.1 Na/Ca antiporter [Legionella hackeliae]CEK11079.1 Ca2 /Na antiporter [Legionella hackeliae]STX47827.1 Ca2 /Na antiporter [Legionella hackeliae]
MVILLVIISFIALLWAANQLVTGASGIAAYYRLSPLVIGFTLVALGTSAPEIMIAITASIEGYTDITIGNAIGTNIANIGLVLGLTTLIKPIRVQSTLMRREYPLLFLVMLFSYSLMLDGYLGVLDGCLLLLMCLAILGYFILITRQQRPQKQLTMAFQQAALGKHSIKSHIVSLLLGLIVLPISSKYLINTSLELGHILGISDLVMGLTFISIGTSLPELATSIVAITKGADDIAVGNILGANIFNLLAVMIFPSIIHPAAISTTLLWRDIPVMFITTFVLLWINYRNKKRLVRWHGGILVLIYCCYMLSLIINAVVNQ